MKLCYATAVTVFLASACFGAEADAAREMFTAIRNNDLSTVKSMAAKEANVNVRGDRGTTPLMYASAYGSIDAMKLLLDAGADVNARNAFDATALMWSVNEPAKVKLLIEHKADVNAKSKTGRTALMLAALHNGSDRVADLLLANGASAGAADNDGLTFLGAASLGWNPRQVRIAIEKGADVNAKSKAGFTPLMNAAANGDVASVKLLLSKGAEVNAVTTDGIDVKVKNGPIALGKFTALMLASVYGPPEIVDLLLRAGARVDPRDIRGMTPLHYAVATEFQSPEIVRLLLKAGADTNVKTLTGESVVDWAAKYSVPDVMSLLPARTAAEKPAPVVNTAAKAEISTRAAAERSLQLLQKVNNSFMSTGGCVACHAQNLMALTANVAKAHAFKVDEAGLKEHVSAAKAAFSRNGDRLLLRFDGGGSMDTLDYALLHFSAANYQPDSMTDAMVHNLIAEQLADGSWHNGGGSRAPMQDSDIVRTALSLRGIKLFSWEGRNADLASHVDAAHAWLLRAKPVYNEEYVMQLLGLQWAGDHGNVTAEVARKLTAQQRSDGGWAQNANLRSDAYATGQTLFALSEAGALKPSGPAFQKGVRFLLTTQHEDGSWYVKSRAPKLQPYFQSGFPYDHDQWISMAATSWAAIALTLAAEPVSVAQASR